MAYPEYPIDRLPYPVRESYSGQYAEQPRAVKMDSGRSRMRRRHSVQPDAITISFRFTYKQLEYFEAWLKWKVANAVGYFTLALNPDLPAQTYRLTKYPDISYDPGANWIVDCAVEIVRAAPTGSKITQLRTFPITLPMPEQSGYGITRPDAVTRSNVTGGLASERNRFVNEVGIVTMKWILDSNEILIWDDFVHNQLFGGLAPFKGWFTNGRGAKSDQVIQFVESPKKTTNGQLYMIEVKAQTMNIPTMTYLEFIGSSNITEADNTKLAESGSINKILYHDGSYAEFDYTNEPVITF